MLSIRPVWTRLRGRALRRHLIDEADATIEVAPATRRDFAPIVALPDELDRITAFRETSTEEARHALAGRGVEASATRLFAIDDAVIADGCVLSRRNLDVLGPGPRRALLTGRPEPVGEALLCSGYYTERYFYHWVFDGWPREMLGQARGLRSLWLDRTPWTHEPGYRAMIGTRRDAVAFARVGRLWIADDGGVNAARAAWLHDLRRRVRAGRRPTGAARVFIRRGRASVGRGLVNEDAVTATLEARGFTILAPEDEPPERIADTLHDARIVVTMEGSAAVHAIMAAPEDAGLVLMQPPAAFNVLLRHHLGALGQRFGITVGDPAGGDDIRQPVDRLLRTIDLMADAVR